MFFKKNKLNDLESHSFHGLPFFSHLLGLITNALRKQSKKLERKPFNQVIL